jgi:hypothetical protein
LALLETGLDNELLALDTGLENSAMAAEEQQAGTYWVITSRAKGGANNPFGGSATANQTSQLVQMTEDQIRKEYQDSGQLQDLFGSLDNYMGYINDSQEWIQSADWMLVAPEYEVGSKEWAFLNGEDLAWGPGEREKIQQKIIADRVAARTSAFDQWMNGEEGQTLMQKYGINPVIYNNDGDQFKWTGSGYQKTIKVDDHASFSDYVKAVLTSVVVGGVTGQLFNAAYSAVGGLVNPISGSWGPAGKMLGGILAGGAGATAGGVTYEDAMGALNNPNVIVNLQEEFGGQNGIDNEDGTRRYSDWNLPEGYIYNEARNAVIHVASGEEYPVTVGMYSWYVDLPDNEDASDGGAGSTSTNSSTNTTTSATTTTTTTTGAGGENPGGTYEGKVLTNGTYGDITIDDRDVWGDGNEYAGWVLVSNTGVWGESGISVIYNPGTGFYQEIDWDNGTYDQRMEDTDQENPNPFDTSGTGGDSAGTSGTGTTTAPTSPAPAEGDACDLGGGNTGVIKDGKCVATSATLPNTGVWPSTNSPNNTGQPPPTSTTSTTTTQSPSTTPTTTTTPSTSTTPSANPSNVPAGEIVGTGVWPASGTGGGTGDGNGPEGSGDGDGGGDGDGNGNGDGNNNGNGLSNLAASRGSSKAHWDRLFAAKEFQSRRGQFGKPTGTSRELNSSNYQMRQNLMNSLWDDLA